MKKNFSALSMGLAVILAVNSPGYAQKKVTVVKKPITTVTKKVDGDLIPNDPSVKIGKLSNGLTYYIKRNTEPKNRAELYLATRIGSLMEDDNQQGLAHFTEHMAFNGTKDFPKNEMIDYLQKAGIRFGADLNAYTSFDHTVYQLPIPTDSILVFKNGFKILANWAGKIVMEGEEIDKERGVIVEEDRQRGKNAQDRMSKQLLPLLLKGSRYADRLPIGKIDILNSFTYDKIRNFYKDWYRPNLQAVIAVGDFDVNEVEQLIKNNFSDLTNPANPRPRPSYDLPDNKAPLVKIVTDPEQQYNVAQIMYKQRGGVTKTTADYKKSIMYGMINSMLGARIQEIMQKNNAPFLQAQSGYGAYQGGLVPNINAFQSAAVSTSGATLEKAFTAILTENERMNKYGFLQSELDVAKKNIAAGNEMRLKEKDKIKSASLVQKYLNNFLTGSIIPSTEFSYELTKKALADITLDQVNALAKTLITKENQIIIVQAPEKEKANLPSEAQLLTALKNAENKVTAYVDNSVNQPLLDKKPVAGKVMAEQKFDKIGVTELTLSNGIKVLLKPTDFKNDQIIFNSFSKGGTSLATDANFRSVEMVSLIPQSGVGPFNPTQLNKLLAGNTGRGGSYVEDLYQGYGGSAAPKDLETAFQMVYAYATNPRKDTEIFNKNMSDYKVSLENKNANPQSVFADIVQAVLSSYHKRAMPVSIADLNKVSLDEAYNFYKDRFADNSEQIFVIVGNFTVEAIKPLLETYIASLPSLNKKQNFVDNGINPPKGKVSKTVYKGLEDKASVQLYIHGDYDYTAQNNIQMNALKAALEIKIMERLREKESGVYSPQVGLSLSKYPTAHYYFTISFSCATANVEKLIAAALEEVDQIKNNGATTDDISKFKSEEQRQIELSLRDNNFWLGYLTNRLKFGDDLNQILNVKERLNSVTVETSKATAQKYLNKDNYIRLVLMPQK
ncbi:MAG: insulinase family protein [Candidatus Pedobacter colombiensis]|uniref:Insulinase family protein n=1 Tax=Candidatus Pedobacter colombiensis TaxID=3121371 RepID=A0AAJ6B8U3_9SPHI|nr:M16 family metallopeptidase [Pedobacter sp.]WEK19503.1 MAG: insulinase family protein [Pedobacter sp.]